MMHERSLVVKAGSVVRGGTSRPSNRASFTARERQHHERAASSSRLVRRHLTVLLSRLGLGRTGGTAARRADALASVRAASRYAGARRAANRSATSNGRAIERRLRMLAHQVGLPIEPPRRNANSRLALESGELVRARAGDESSAAFHHAVSRAFFVRRRGSSGTCTSIASHAAAVRRHRSRRSCGLGVARACRRDRGVDARSGGRRRDGRAGVRLARIARDQRHDGAAARSSRCCKADSLSCDAGTRERVDVTR